MGVFWTELVGIFFAKCPFVHLKVLKTRVFINGPKQLVPNDENAKLGARSGHCRCGASLDNMDKRVRFRSAEGDAKTHYEVHAEMWMGVRCEWVGGWLGMLKTGGAMVIGCNRGFRSADAPCF